MPKKHHLVEYFEGVREGIEKHTLTYSGWLNHVKKLSSEEIENLLHTDEIKLHEEYEQWYEEGVEKRVLENLAKIVKIVYPIQREKLVVHFKWVKRQLMKEFEMDRWKIDEILLSFYKETFDEQCFAFYFSSCGFRPGSRLNYISYAKQRESATFGNSFCFITIDIRNKYVKKILGIKS